MEHVETVAALREARAGLNGRVGLVPTMGALHDGHMSLIQAAQDVCDAVIATIFVNPTQFGPNEDLDSYPRQLEQDLRVLRAAGVDIVFTPTPEVMYPPDFQTTVTVGEVTQGLEGAKRPGHFEGVATVVLKLFMLTMPDAAFFGQKDAQQVVVLRQMVRDLNVNVDVVPVPTMREADGLAMSSRNGYLDPDERAAARVLSRALRAASDAWEAGERDANVLRRVIQRIIREQPLAEIDYVSIADSVTLTEVEGLLADDAVVLASLTVRVGKPRLLDNMLLPVSLNTAEGLRCHLGRPL